MVANDNDIYKINYDPVLGVTSYGISEMEPIQNADKFRTVVPVMPRNKIGRNEDCPCNSGKKFKRCCGAVK